MTWRSGPRSPGDAIITSTTRAVYGMLQYALRPAPSTMLFRLRERRQRPRRTDPLRFELHVSFRPGLAIVGRAISNPREAVRLDVVVTDLPDRRFATGHSEALLDVHLIAHASRGAEIEKSITCIRAD